MPHAHSLPDEPTVSVVVPYYGIDFSALVKCVGSLLDQDYSQDHITIFVIDNNEIEACRLQCLGGAASYFTSLYQVPMPLEIEA